MNAEAQLCQEHSEPIILQDDDNVKWCLACVSFKCQNEIVNVEEFIDEYQEILNNQTNENKILMLQKILKLIEKYKQLLINTFNERKSMHQVQKVFLEYEYSDMYDCCSFVFNSEQSGIFIGQDCDINLYKFKNGKITKLLQTLTQHKLPINCLIYMNKSNILVSGSDDGSIIIWNQDYNGNWKLYQKLEDHSIDYIYSLINNDDEDLLISGSETREIKFWRKINMNWNCQQTIRTKFKVQSLSLSKSDKYLIAGGDCAKEFVVVEQNSNQEWFILQIIKVNSYGQQLCFTSENRFVYQGVIDCLEIYSFDQEKKQFIKNNQVQVQKWSNIPDLFPCKYIESKNLLIIKNSKNLNFFRIDQHSNFVLEQSIQFNNRFYGNISNDGQFIITQELNSDKIQIRELQYLK